MAKTFPTVLTVLALVLSLRASAGDVEPNTWPFWTARLDEATGEARAWEAAGPLLFHSPAPENGTYRGLRPLYLERRDARGTYAESTFLYPLYSRRDDGDTTDWTVFNLINSSHPDHRSAAGDRTKALDVWPFYFSRETGDPDTSYHGLFPVAGTIKSRFGYDRLHWVIFPLYWQSERKALVTTSTPWPFIKRSSGGGAHGFALWPLFGREAKPGAYRHQYWLWPLIYKHEDQLSAPRPSVKEGFLPFYTLEHSATLKSENFLWPFFGYTDRSAPAPYHETRWLWPLLVQGRGPQHYVNRWGPFYTHSIRKGVDKKWYLWPLVRREQWTDDGLVQTKRQFFWFIYWSMEQRSATNPALAPAEKTHLWPLLSIWDNGAGRRQAQFPSPLEVFFPHNEKIRRLYTPLFALYRYDQRTPDDVRQSLLWNAITWHHSPGRREFHLGPLFSTRRDASGRRIAIGNGLIALRRPAGAGKWRLFLFDFPSRQDKVPPATSR
jgi:hypothetical protein